MRGRSPSPSPGTQLQRNEEERRRERLRQLEEAEARQLAEERRLVEEQRQLRELDEARKKRQELQEARRRNLGSAFALTEDDIDEDGSQKDLAAWERANAKRRAQERLAPLADAPAAASSSARRPPPTAAPVREVQEAARPPIARPDDGAAVTALDIDGTFHEHRFAEVWRDWDASKRGDPGEVARQFMKIAAIKRRAQTRTEKGGGEASPPRRGRSRSHRRR